jgi:peptide subunit release factor 1 (eRF1)
MNTIQVTTTDGTVNYTESEVVRFIEKVKELDAYKQTAIDSRHKVRDFFSESEWSNGEATFSKSDVNELLEAIGANKLTTRYTATYTVTGTFSVDADDEDDAESIFTDNVSVDFYDGDIDVDQIEVHDVEEE